MNDAELESWLGPGGRISQVLTRHEQRPGQLQMARRVAATFEAGGILVAEAGTGTGKTLAYLLPALLSGKKVVVSTATKNLQDQIFQKDLPLLAEAGLEFKAAYMKGRGNYLCLIRYERFDGEPVFLSKEEARLYPRLRAWAAETETGDRSEIELPDSFSTWRELSATADTCLGQKCPAWDRCFVTRMRAEAQRADVVVVNHHLFFADLGLRTGRSNPGGEVLPPFEAVVFDEAHALEEVASDHFGASASSGRLEDLVVDGEKGIAPSHSAFVNVAPLWQALRAAGARLFSAIGAALPPSLEATPLDGPIRRAADGELDELLSLLDETAEALEEAEEPEVASVGRRAEDLATDLRFLIRDVSPRHVFWAEQRTRSVMLRAAPIDVAEALRNRLWNDVGTAVLASATLSTAGRFDYPLQRLGLDGSPEEEQPLAVEAASWPSPFDYAKQALLYCPIDVPEPTDPAFALAASHEIERLCEMTGGRAFVLCTSLRQMQELHRLLESRLRWPVLLQGEAPKGRLLSRFIEEPSVLFASQSFWEGVDVPGEALSLVVIDKLPFAPPKDPVVAARIELARQQGRSPFDSYQVPHAALALRQGFGRLIRTAHDKGIVAVLDRRLRTKGYGRTFLDTLPPAQRIGDLGQLERAWQAIQATP